LLDGNNKYDIYRTRIEHMKLVLFSLDVYMLYFKIHMKKNIFYNIL